jgi:Ca2+-binding EF-hand superfamily protein
MNAKARKSHQPRLETKYTLVIGVTIVLLAVNAFAAGNKSQLSKSNSAPVNDNFARADENRDGKLSRGEAGDFLVYEVFTACDRNHDGRISLQEWLRVKPGETAAFNERDGNDDGLVTLAEAIEYGRRGGAGLTLIKQADKNRDGKIDRAELQAYLTKQ